MARPRTSVRNALTGAGLAGAVALPLVGLGVLPAASAAPAPVEISAADIALAARTTPVDLDHTGDVRLGQLARAQTVSDGVHAAVDAARTEQAAAAAAQAAAAQAAAAAAAQAAAEKQRADELAAAQQRADRSNRDPRSYAQALLAERGQAGQFGCLNLLWNRESGWSLTATNRSSGAYGIPQSLPGSKMASAGADWRTNAATQIQWGLSYIAASYGSPCGAWAHSQAYGWY